MKGQGRVVEPVVRVNLDEMIARGERIVVDVGCGNRKKAGRIGIDRVDLEGVDIVADLEQGLQFFPDASVDEIHCRSVLEHVEDMKGLLGEMLRVLKPQGQAHIFGRITRIRSPGGGAVSARCRYYSPIRIHTCRSSWCFARRSTGSTHSGRRSGAD